MQDASDLQTWKTIFWQAHTQEGPYQKSCREASAREFSDYLDPDVAGSAPDDFPLTSPWWPLVLVSLYVFGTPVLTSICRALGTNGKSTVFRTFVVLHNLSLLVYSAWASYLVFPLLLKSMFVERGYWPTYCDDGCVTRDVMAAHTFFNYLSKAYEFIDTAVLIVKGKDVSWLQRYHHTGIILVMWMCTVSRHPHSPFMVGYNAFVHTVMYTYFMCTEIFDRQHFSWVKVWITRLQLLQFFCGVFVAVPAFLGMFGYWGKPWGRGNMEDCLTGAQAFDTAFANVYLWPLIFLFVNFYVRTYLSKRADAKKKAE